MATRWNTRVDNLDESWNNFKAILREHWFAYLLFVPTATFLTLILWFPFFRGVIMSFYEWPLIGDPTWVGTGNYQELFQWDPFYTSLRVTAIFATTTIFQLAVALLAALAVTGARFKNIMSVIFLLPYTMPAVVTGTIWLYLLDPDFGIVFSYLVDSGILETPIYWGTDGGAALIAIIFATSWTFWPFMFLIITASLESIPSEYYEAAEVFGASRLQKFTKITYPQIKSALLVAIIIRIVWNLTKISQPLQMTGGGPGFDTSVLAILLYRFAWLRGELGMGYTIGIVLLVLMMAFIAMFVREFERETGEAKK